MDIAMTKIITDLCAEVLTANGFKAEGDTFESENAVFTVKYDEDRKLYILLYTDKAANAGEAEMASWLFDEGTKSDATVIGEDFRDQIAIKLGIKKSALQSGNVVMPTRNAAGSENTIDSLTQKILAVFPAFKDDYREHMTEYGSFLSVTFYKKTIIPKLRELSEDVKGNRKLVEKVFKMFAEIYYNCDDITMDTLCGTIIAGAFYDRPDKLSDCLAGLDEEYPFFISACRTVVKTAGRSKKVRAVFEDK